MIELARSADKPRRRNRRRTVWVWALLAFGLAACTEPSSDDKKAAGKRSANPHLVETQTVATTPISTAHERTGTLRLRRTVRIHSQEEGRISALPWFEGDRVEAGAVLVQIEDDLIRAELAKAQANRRQAKIDLDRVRRLSKKRATSEDELARAETALDIAQAEEQLLRTRLGYMRIEAPFAGVVTERAAEPGDVVAKHTPLLTLADPDSLVAEIQVSELLLPRLASGDPVQLRIDAIGPGTHPGRILRIHPELDRLSRQGTIEVALEPIPPTARAGQFVRATLRSARVERLLVPFAAVRRDRQGEFIYRLNGDKVEPVPVHTGIRIKDQIEILDGLKAGNEIVARGFLGLTPGKTVQRLAPSTGSAESTSEATPVFANAPDATH